MASGAAARGPDGAERERAVLDRVRSAGDETGFVPFDRFMDIALYAEGAGFYTRTGPTLGPRGDFYTAAHVNPLFARTIARRLLAVREALGPERPFSVVELGPGDGTLAEGVIRALGPGASSGGPVEYVLIERSGTLRALALAKARSAGASAGLSVRTSASVSADGPFSGAVLANEVLDAQPVRRLRWSGAAWTETGVRWDGAHLEPAELPLTRGFPQTALPPSPPRGTVVEISPVAEAMVREVADHLASGVFIVLDYGMEEPELRSAHPSGTLAAVQRHRAVADPLESPGSTDLSVFVNFTRIRETSRTAGFVELGFGRQAEALGRWGYPSLLESELRTARSPEEEVRVRLASKNLLFGFDRFQVLELAAPASADALARLSSRDPGAAR